MNKGKSKKLEELYDLLLDTISDTIKEGNADPHILSIAAKVLKDSGIMGNIDPTDSLKSIQRAYPFKALTKEEIEA